MRNALLAGVALALCAGPAHALIVSDPVTEANTMAAWMQAVAQDAIKTGNQLTMINNQISQLVQLRNTFAAISHGDLAAISALSPQLSALGLTNPLGSDMAGLVDGVSGLAGSVGALSSSLGQTASLAQNLLRTDQFYAPTGSDFRAMALRQGASSAAYQKAVAQAALDSSAARLTELAALRQSLSGTTDLKASADATKRLAGEQAMAQAQGNQLAAIGIMQRAQATTDAARELQAWRCSAEALVAQAGSSAASASGGMVVLVSGNTAPSRCALPPGGGAAPGGAYASADTPGTLASYTGTSATPDDGTTLARMTAQPWGQQAADNASALGVNPVALAATCSLESNCRANPGGTGTISGAFQMSNGTYAQTVNEVRASNPDLAASITTKNDPASQSIAAAQYLKDGAQALQAAGIANPSVLDVRGFYNYGPGNGATLANASGNQLMASTLTGLSAATLRANGITDSMTVGQWRAGIVNKIGENAASQPVLKGTNA